MNEFDMIHVATFVNFKYDKNCIKPYFLIYFLFRKTQIKLPNVRWFRLISLKYHYKYTNVYTWSHWEIMSSLFVNLYPIQYAKYFWLFLMLQLWTRYIFFLIYYHVSSDSFSLDLETIMSLNCHTLLETVVQ